jgi:hypothetical protein
MEVKDVAVVVVAVEPVIVVVGVVVAAVVIDVAIVVVAVVVVVVAVVVVVVVVVDTVVVVVVVVVVVIIVVRVVVVVVVVVATGSSQLASAVTHDLQVVSTATQLRYRRQAEDGRWNVNQLQPVLLRQARKHSTASGNKAHFFQNKCAPWGELLPQRLNFNHWVGKL